MTRILVIDDDEAILDNVLELLEAEGFDAIGAPDGKTGVAAAIRSQPDLIICDVTMPAMDGHGVLRQIRSYPATASAPFVFLTARATRADMRAGMNLGADDYLTKPFTRRELLDTIRGRLKRHPKTESRSGDEGPIVASAALQTVFEEATRAAQCDLPVLLLGETGVGKDVLAHHIHQASSRQGQPYVPLNCAALSDSLLESELFGYEKGAFTGATDRRLGLFETAHGGTIFLDEIGDMPPSTQVKLLRVLQDRKVMRVGGRSYFPIDVRFVSATNRNLTEDGDFRRDLYYRIGGIVLTVPPLRERIADIAPLAERFANDMSHRLGRAPLPIEPAAMTQLQQWPWPGNVRELRNVVERSVAMTTAQTVSVSDLPAEMRAGTAAAQELPDEVRRHQRELERTRILEALSQHSGNQTKAAQALGISRRTLINRLDEFDLPRPRK